MFRKVHFKYLIMRVRAKISFMAFERRMTAKELIVYTIKKCFVHLMKAKSIPEYSVEDYERH